MGIAHACVCSYILLTFFEVRYLTEPGVLLTWLDWLNPGIFLSTFPDLRFAGTSSGLHIWQAHY